MFSIPRPYLIPCLLWVLCIISGTESACTHLTAYSSSSVITVPNYPNDNGTDVTACWILKAEYSVNQIVLSFSTGFWYSSPYCLADYLDIFDGDSRSSPLIENKQFCGSSPVPDMVSSGDYLYLDLHLNRSVFTYEPVIKYRSVGDFINCVHLNASSSWNYVKSPNHPNQYENYMSMCWIITASDSDKRIRLSFTHFSLERSPGCQNDYLAIMDGDSPHSPLIGKYCGSSSTSLPRLASSGHQLYLHFSTNNNVTGYGFRTQYNYLDEKADCSYLKAHSTLTSLTAPVDTNHTDSNLPMCWVITAPYSEQKILLSFVYFELNSTDSYLSIMDGPSENSALIGRYFGSRSIPSMASSDIQLYLNFHTDTSLTGDGFHIQYKAVDDSPYCNYRTAKSTWTTLKSPYHFERENNIHACWVITAIENSDHVRFSFHTFSLELSPNCTEDYLSIMDGGSESSPLIGKYCGPNNNLPEIISSGTQLYLQYHTGDGNVGIGFRIQYISFVTHIPTTTIAYEDTVSDCTYLTATYAPTPLTSPNYPNNYENNLSICWIITATHSDENIFLSFLDFELEQSSSCAFDYLAIRNGDSLDSPLIGKYCGSTYIRSITSSGNQMYLHFKTDSSVTKRGFHIQYKVAGNDSDCTYLTATYDPTALTSPNYPNDYENNLSICWIITATNSEDNIFLTFLDFELEWSTGCDLDYLAIMNGDSLDSPLIGKYCGSNHIPSITSIGNQVYLHFKTDISVTERGFHIQYKAAGETSGCTYLTASSRSTSLTSPNYPYNYENNLSMCWIIRAVYSDDKIRLSFSNFDLESSSTCVHDYLAIMDGDSSSSPLIGKYCGSRSIPTMTSSGSQLYLYFKTDSSVTRSGFHIRYQAGAYSSSCSYRQAQSTWTSLTSPNYPNNYDNDINTCWIITAVDSSDQVLVSFMDFDLESSNTCQYDYLLIRDGGSNSSPRIGKYCGSQRPTNIGSSGAQLYLNFRTDSSVTGKGFHIQYKSGEYHTFVDTENAAESSITVIVSVTVAVALGFGLLVLFICCIHRKGNKNRHPPPSQTVAMTTVTQSIAREPGLSPYAPPLYECAQHNYDAPPSYEDAMMGYNPHTTPGAAAVNPAYT